MIAVDVREQEARFIRTLMEAMREEVMREFADASPTDTGDWTSHMAGQYGAMLYQRARQIVRKSADLPQHDGHTKRRKRP